MILKVMRTYLFSLLFVSVSLVVIEAQVPERKVSGSIRDAVTQTPLEGVNVIIVENSLGSQSDSDGSFVIPGIPDGSYTIQASMTGYNPEKKKIRVLNGESDPVVFLLKTRTYQIDSINIVARKDSHDPMEEPFTEPMSLLSSISTITNTDLEKQGAVTLIDALNYIPGGLTETRGRQVKQFFSVRGQKYPYPDYALNGVWQQEFEELPYFFSTSDIERIEVIRSSAALLTGLTGMEGLINVKTKEYLRPEANLELEYGSYNNLHSHLSHGNTIGNFAYSAGIGYDKSDGPSGRHVKEEMADLYTQVSWRPSEKLTVKANLFYLNGKRELMIAQEPADKRYIDMLQNFDPYKATLANIKLIYKPTQKLTSEMQLFYSARNPAFNDEVKKTSVNEKDFEYGLNFTQSVAVSSSNILRFGGIYYHWTAPDGKRFYSGKRCDTETLSGVIVDEHKFGPVTLDAGFKWTKTFLRDYAAFNIEGEGGQFRTVTPVTDEWEPAIVQGSLGATYQISNTLSLFYNSLAGQVKPRQGSLGTDLDELSNEMRYKFDLGTIKRIGETGKISLTSFLVFQKDAIALGGTIFTDTLTGIIRPLYVNRDQDQLGIEGEIVMPQLFGFLSPFFNLTAMKSRVKEEGKMVTNKENPVFISGGGVYMDKRGMELNILFKYVSSFENQRFASASAGPQVLGDFFTLDMNAGYTIPFKAPVKIYFRVRNLTDKKYSTVVGYPDIGRMLYLGMQLNFKKI